MATFYSLYFDIHENLVHAWNDLAFSLGKREKDVLIFSHAFVKLCGWTALQLLSSGENLWVSVNVL